MFSLFFVFWLFFVRVFSYSSDVIGDVYDGSMPTRCEVCKLFAIEFMSRFNETASSEMLYLSGDSNNPVPYAKSELRLVEILAEPDLCDRMLQYRFHKERKGIARFEKSLPQTFEVLKKLMAQGVDVKTDVPHELWDSPSIEITILKRSCVNILSEYEEAIEYWFYNLQDERDFESYICRDFILENAASSCLDELPEENLTSQNISSSNSSELPEENIASPNISPSNSSELPGENIASPNMSTSNSNPETETQHESPLKDIQETQETDSTTTQEQSEKPKYGMRLEL